MATVFRQSSSPGATSAAPPAQSTVCQLLHSLTIGGAEVLAARLARRQRGRYRFVFACLDDLGPLGNQLRNEGFPVHVLGRRPGLDLGCVRRFAAFLRSEDVDLIHAHQYTPYFYASLARRLYRRPPILFTEHGRFFPDLPNRKRIIANRLLLERRDRVVGVGESVRQALIHNEGIPPSRVGVIYNGVDLEAFSSEAADRESVRRELGLRSDEFAIFQVARLDHLKDHSTAIRTIARVVQRRPVARLVLIGEGPEEPRIRAEVERLGVSSSVLLLGLRTDVARLLPAADAFLLTSISEGIPVTLIEAMGARLPVVATAVGGIPEVVLNGKTGLLAPSGADAALADGLLRLVVEPGFRERLGLAGRERALSRFPQHLMHTSYLNCYEQMLNG